MFGVWFFCLIFFFFLAVTPGKDLRKGNLVCGDVGGFVRLARGLWAWEASG